MKKEIQKTGLKAEANERKSQFSHSSFFIRH